jgi:hypothetical protein
MPFAYLTISTQKEYRHNMVARSGNINRHGISRSRIRKNGSGNGVRGNGGRVLTKKRGEKRRKRVEERGGTRRKEKRREEKTVKEKT